MENMGWENTARRVDSSDYRSTGADLLRRELVAASFRLESVEHLTKFWFPAIFYFVFIGPRGSVRSSNDTTFSLMDLVS